MSYPPLPQAFYTMDSQSVSDPCAMDQGHISDDPMEQVVDVVCNGHNLAILGTAGTGKTTLIERLVRLLRQEGKTVQVTASTGIAAVNLSSVEAQTVHSFFGMLDGRFSANDLIRRVQQDESCEGIQGRIKEMNVLIVDEASMISARTFTHMEALCRNVRDSEIYFGGVQVVMVLDPRQLPPVPDPLHGDEGKFCFESNVWANCIHHKIILTKVHRALDPELSTLIEETFAGNVSQESDILLGHLSRPLPDINKKKVSFLYSDNLSSDIRNRECLEALPGDSKQYLATDTGSADQLEKGMPPKKLLLKVGARVMLKYNIDQRRGLVNGAQGHVTALGDDYAVCTFVGSNNEQTVKIQAHLFTKFSTREKRVVASRLQLPLKLSYSTTIHKAQGLTLQAVEVDGSKIFQPGMLGVAISRVRRLECLRVVNYRKGLCPPPPAAISEYLKPFNLPPPPMDNDSDSDSDSNSDPDDDSDLPQTDLPQTCPSVDILLQEVSSDNKGLDTQEAIDGVIQGLHNKEEKVAIFLKTVYHKLAESFETLTTGQIKAAAEQLHTKTVYMYMNSGAYKDAKALLLDTREPTTAQSQVCMRLVFKVREHLVTECAEKRKPDPEELTSGPRHRIAELQEHGVAGAKVRYIGGSVVARLASRRRKSRKIHVGTKSISRFYALQQQLDMLDQLDKAPMISLYPETVKLLEEIQQKRLVMLSDEAYLMYHSLECRRLALHTFTHLMDSKGHLPQKIEYELLHSADLKNLFFTAVTPMDIKLPSQFVDLTAFDDKTSITQAMRLVVYQLADRVVTINEVYTDIVHLYLKSGHKRFRQEVVLARKITKQEAHRRKVLQKRNAKRKSPEEEDCETEHDNMVAKIQSEDQVEQVTDPEEGVSGYESDSERCAGCGSKGKPGAKWIQCDNCSSWWEGKCSGIRGRGWQKYGEKGTAEWLCINCKQSPNA